MLRGKLSESNEWQELLQEPKPDRRGALVRGLVNELDEEDLEFLLRSLPPETGDPMHPAMTLIVATVNMRLESLSAAQKSSIESAMEGLAPKGGLEYRRTHISNTALLMLRKINPEKAERLMLSFPIDDFDEKAIREYLHDLSSTMPAPRLIAHLQGLKAKGGIAGTCARDSLEKMGYIDPERIQELGKEFRDTHLGDALGQFHDHYLANADVMIDQVIELLGPPDETGDRYYGWQSTDWHGGLFLYTDARGYVEGIKMDD